MHIKGKNNWIKHLDFMGINLLSFALAFIIAFLMRFGNLSLFSNPDWKSVFVVMLLVNLVVSFVMDPFSGILRRPYHEDLIKVVFMAVYTFIIVAIFLYALKIGAVYSRLVLGYTFTMYIILDVIFITIRKKLLIGGDAGAFNIRERNMFVMVDYGEVEETIHGIYSSSIKEYNVCGLCFPAGGYDSDTYNDIPVVELEGLTEYIINNHIDDVFVAANPSTLSSKDYRTLVDNGVTVHLDINSMIGTATDDQFVSRVGVNKTISVGPYAFNGRRMMYLFVKRVLDIILGLIGCIFLLPLMIIVKISNLISGDKAPMFYYQTRVGQYGKEFRLAKFRSMVPDADEILKEMLKEEHYRKEWEENQKFDDDPRITKIGRVLRKTSLDEFPQFINILKGDMSLVGPRPLIPGELEEHDGLTLYNKVKPGVTGWWGCNGRSNINYKERLELEYYYVRHCSLYLDVVCILKTALMVIKREGAQ